MNAEKARRTVLAVEIPRDELVLRLMMAATQMRPPPGITAAEAITMARRASPETVRVMYEQADVAVAYFHECVNAARQPT